MIDISRWCQIVILAVVVSTFGYVQAQTTPEATPEATENLTNANIVYLVVSNLSVLEGKLSLPQELENLFPLQSTSSWEQVLKINEEHPIDILIIDKTALDKVDALWVAQAYHQGMTVVGFDIRVD